MKNKETYLSIADIFRYPEADSPSKVETCQKLVDTEYPEAGKVLQPFTEHFLSLDEDGREELFTKTFDVQPICYLDLGYVIFGEDYKRGSFLLHMKEEQKRIGRDCSPELPDNLYHVLHLLTIHTEKEFVDELVAKILVPGVKKMIQEFDIAKIELKMKVIKKLHNALIAEELNVGNVYHNAFLALLNILEQDFSEAIASYNPKEENLINESFFNKSNSVNQLVNNYKID
jgi:nitrate reductase assembly molybdenum cofactor insertion protein NarJ